MKRVSAKIIVGNDDKFKALVGKEVLDIDRRLESEISEGEKLDGYIKAIKHDVSIGDTVVVGNMPLRKLYEFSEKYSKSVLEALVKEKIGKRTYLLDLGHSIITVERNHFTNRSKEDYFNIFTTFQK